MTRRSIFSLAATPLFAQKAVDVARSKMDFGPSLIIGKTTEELNLRAQRPMNSALASERYTMLPPLEDALLRYIDQLDIHNDQQEMT